MPQNWLMKRKKIASGPGFLKPRSLRRAILATERFMLYKNPGVGSNNQVGAKSMEPQLDFRQALSSPEENAIPSVEAVHTVLPRSLAGLPATNPSKDLTGRVRLSRAQMTNISFVTIACVGGLACAFYFFNGAEFLRAAGAWGREFLYPRPSAVATNIDVSKQQTNSGQAGNPEDPDNSRTPSHGPNQLSPFDRNIWPSNLSQAATFANVNSSGTVSPDPPNSPFSFVGSTLNQLNLLQRGADTLFQSFYQTAVSMTPKNVTRTASRTTASARRKISSTQQDAAAQANAGAAASKSAARTAQQTANAQSQAATNAAARTQSQSPIGGGPGGSAAGLGGGTGLGGTGLGSTGLGSAGLGGVSGVVGGLGHR